MYKFLDLKNKSLLKLKFILFVSFLLYFLSTNLIYSHSIQKDEDYLIPMGNLIQIDAELENLVVKNFIEGSSFCVGDSILKVNGTQVNSYKDFTDLLSNLSTKDDVVVLVKRGENTFSFKTTKNELEKVNCNNYISGFATLTYINPKTNRFGAVGHPISIGLARKVPIKNGNIYTTKDLTIDKSCRGHVGCINAVRKDVIGEFTHNSDFGIKGEIATFKDSLLKPYKVASLDEVKLGKAQIILQTGSYTKDAFDIQIVDIQLQHSPKAKTFKIKVVDKDLLALTGGIVQGMSGAPIVQGDKIIGAVSHAIENNPALGYAVYIKWMNEN
ncbi:PDZ domain-containing protein [Romboutsia sp. 1001216sp1]|nr:MULTISPECIES: SpoIVB peptidase S55 domain-containing protein [unclassified Romboutsia]MDB8793807.1 PDZ domain-containing protein [Romboutsia sp. 1001216sp1]MDB8797523.1 PDZ domain-containing protein [Romboutsia sp. 1001216sp1]MDB8799939.1 PDZ domain-containing protein [Romboutsia sp. 1001216sp1]MDB8802730.1 PDZ domain-containing protein [Romboutsia sp. 1001216sp1]MDB8814127.1 PDZ domain-containing protein [Romboutsia sp. 1001216sp1]